VSQILTADRDTRTGRSRRVRSAAAVILAVAFAALLPAAITAAWIRGTILNTSGYVTAVAPLADNPAVRGAVRSAAASEIGPALSRAASALPPPAALLTGPLSSGLTRLADDGINAFMTSPAFQRPWVTAITSAHRQLISTLNGNSTAMTTANGQVVLNLAPLISAMLRNISSELSALTGKTITPPAITTIPATACRQIASFTRTRMPADCGQIPLLPASALAGARRAFRLLSTATLALLILTPTAGAAALLAAPRRRRTLLQMALGSTLTVLAASITAARLQSSLISRAQPRYQPAVTALLHALTSSFFTPALWCITGSLILAAATLLSGPLLSLLR
jgi:hypothetical protein